MPWESPIYDREKSDVDYAKANRNDPIHYKGAFNYTDMLRITNNMRHIANLSGVSISVRTDWRPLEIPAQSELSDLLNSLESLRSAIFGRHSPIEIPALPIYQYEKINAIERLIFDLEERRISVIAGKRRLNTFQLGGGLI